jgi:hypothetical protein
VGTFFAVVAFLVIGGYALLIWHLWTKPKAGSDEEEGRHW